jgi:ABC-type Fe3+/spermidine/putrescine transport system ATPase subunit
MSRVLLRQVSKIFAGSTAVHPTTLEVPEGHFLTLLGPSGCGKTTTLRMIAGFVEPTAGQILIDDEDVTHLPPQKRGIGMVFQDYALFPHMSIAENIGFGLRERRQTKEQIRTRVAELLDLIRLPEIANRYPAQISGGQAQRVALARAIAYPPRVLLMDEPLGALDLKLRETMQFELRRIQRALRITTVFVTHDQTEAMNLSDTIAVMGGGRVQQMGTPQEIYDRPRTRFVADFIGQINFLDGQLGGGSGDWQRMQAGSASFRVPRSDVSTGRATLAVRPQNVILQNGSVLSEEFDRLEGTVISQVFNGNLSHLRVDLGDTHWTVEARPGAHSVEPGQKVTLGWRPSDARVLGE